MILADRDIRLMPELVSPFRPGALGPCSVDVHLGGSLDKMPYGVTIDPEIDQSSLLESVPLREGGRHAGRWLLGQNVLYLGVTLERIAVPPDMVAFVHGLSSLGRLGLIVHCTAGLVDAGWPEAPITLEMISLGGHMLLRPGQRIAQITWHRLSSVVSTPYAVRGRYAGAGVAPTPSRAHLDAEAPA